MSLNIFESISRKDNTTVTNNGQSIFLTVDCGCEMVQHFICDNSKNLALKENKKVMTERSIFVKLCSAHKKRQRVIKTKTENNITL